MQAEYGSAASDGAKARFGLLLFFIYAIVYAGFVLIVTIAPRVMGHIVFAGLNLAVVYGMGLIIFAIALGLVYSQVATRMESGQRRNRKRPDHNGGTA